jgi:hypothetical protein
VTLTCLELIEFIVQVLASEESLQPRHVSILCRFFLWIYYDFFYLIFRVIRYECCEGYTQRQGEEGCTGVKPLKDILETARDLGAGRFVTYLEESGLAEQLREEGTFTFFAPLDSGFEGYYGNSVSMKIQSFMNSNRYNPVLNYHLSPRKMPSKDFSGNTELNSMHQNQTLRISKYSTGVKYIVTFSLRYYLTSSNDPRWRL